MLKLPSEATNDKDLFISEFIPEITGIDWLKKNLSVDYKEITYYYPKPCEPGKSFCKSRGSLSKKLRCVVKEVLMGEQGLVGYALVFNEPGKTLITLRGKNMSGAFMNKSKIEWIYDVNKSLFIRIVAEQLPGEEMNKSSEDKLGSMREKTGSKYVTTKKLEIIEQKNENDEGELKAESVFAKLAMAYNKPWNKPNYAKGVVTKRITAYGDFIVVSKRALAEKQKEIIREAEQKDEPESRKEIRKTTQQVMNMTLKSRRDLINAVQNGKILNAISHIRLFSLMLLLALIILSSVDYGLFISRYGTIMKNTKTFLKALDMESQIAQATEKTRGLTLLHTDILIDYENYSTLTQYEESLRTDLLEIQATLDHTQKEVTELAKGFDSLKDILLLSRDLSIEFKIGNEYKIGKYNLIESIIMLNSYVFKIANTRLEMLDESNDDIYFLLINGLNGVLMRLRDSLGIMRYNMDEYSAKSLSVYQIVLICAGGTILLLGLSIVPLLKIVQNTKEEILMLFFQIRKGYAKSFAKQCQQFHVSLQKKRSRKDSGGDEDGSDIEESEEANEEDDLVTETENYHRSTGSSMRKLSKGSSGVLGTVFWELAINVILTSYFVVSYFFFGVLLFDANNLLNKSFENIAYMNTAHFTSYLGIRETVLNSTWKIENQSPYSYSQQMIHNLTKFHEYTKDNFGLGKSRISLYFGGFTELVENSLDASACSEGRNNFFTNPDDCLRFAHTIANNVLYPSVQTQQQGLNSLMAYTVEIMKQLVYDYNHTDPTLKEAYINGHLLSDLSSFNPSQQCKNRNKREEHNLLQYDAPDRRYNERSRRTELKLDKYKSNGVYRIPAGMRSGIFVALEPLHKEAELRSYKDQVNGRNHSF
eukprot:TRINITY_DN4228_c0_g1_i1.p1 TRINITY_DN4228_c0_g1~~TRINITY_DN4228_c0_g1_i1.p1  ORF type:complete len:875 (+),score=89.05 TRINITY_DN4228_c0_g1_i1:2533-5157(+)